VLLQTVLRRVSEICDSGVPQAGSTDVGSTKKKTKRKRKKEKMNHENDQLRKSN